MYRLNITLGICVFSFLIVACATAQAPSETLPPSPITTPAGFAAVRQAIAPCQADEGRADGIRRYGKLVCVRGPIQSDFATKLRAIALMPDDIIVLSGPGGDAWTAMDAGEIVEQSGASVVTDAGCASGCSYFIALGARRTIVLLDGPLSFHGGPLSDSSLRRLEAEMTVEALQRTKKTNDRFLETFRRRGIDIRITRRAPESMRRLGVEWPPHAWTLTASEFRAAGVQHLEMESEVLQRIPSP